MKNYRLPVCFLLLTACLGHGSTFEDSMDRLSVENPEFVVHMNLENDFQSLGSFLSQAYLAHLAASPDKPPVPIDFNQLFGHLGLADITSTIWTSEALPEGGFINKSMVEFTESPKGLFLLFGDENLPFSISRTAPGTADLAAELNFNGKILFEILRSFVIDMMGPMGEGLIDAQ